MSPKIQLPDQLRPSCLSWRQFRPDHFQPTWLTSTITLVRTLVEVMKPIRGLGLGSPGAVHEGREQELLPSGKQTTFANRVHRVRTYLVQAGLLEATRRAHFRITERGQSALVRAPQRIDNKLLLEFPEFRHFKNRRKPDGAEQSEGDVGQPAASMPEPVISRATPEELIDAAYREITDE